MSLALLSPYSQALMSINSYTDYYMRYGILPKPKYDVEEIYKTIHKVWLNQKKFDIEVTQADIISSIFRCLSNVNIN